MMRKFCESVARLGLLVLGWFALFPASSEAALTFYSDRSAFNAANPGLPIEDFEESLAPASDYLAIPAPLDSTSNNAAFSPGDILPGISFADRPGPSVNGLIATGIGELPGATKGILANTFTDSLDLLFNPGVGAVGFDLGGSPGPGILSPDSILVEIFGPGGSLGSTLVATLGIDFFGVSSDGDPITRISLLSQNDLAEYIDNVAFGNAVVDDDDDAASVVPEPSSWALFLAVSLVLATWWKNEKHRARARSAA